jgi:transposase
MHHGQNRTFFAPACRQPPVLRTEIGAPGSRLGVSRLHQGGPQGQSMAAPDARGGAYVAAKTNQTYLAAQYRRMAARRGKKRTLIALGHTLLTMVDHLLTCRRPYQDLGAADFDTRDQWRIEHRLVRRWERLGCSVSLQRSAL